ncbi:MAG: SirB2 family protein [Sulfuricellaceae bacterium]|nr:SirB2 family protein [Sulfuricellaceae bacterium]
MDYAVLKLIHVSSVILSISLFILRGIWMLTDSSRLQQRWVRVMPHVIDATLLFSAILLTMSLQQYPGTHGWLSAKIVALLVYIGLGTIAIKRGKTKRARILAWLAAIGVFAYMVGVARTHQALSWLT